MTVAVCLAAAVKTRGFARVAILKELRRVGSAEQVGFKAPMKVIRMRAEISSSGKSLKSIHFLQAGQIDMTLMTSQR
jgi:hypothetical protein